MPTLLRKIKVDGFATISPTGKVNERFCSSTNYVTFRKIFQPRTLSVPIV